MQEVYEFLKEAGTYYLATSEGGQPRVRPFGTIHLFDGKLYIQTGKAKAVSRQMHENPRVELCAMKGNEWLRVEASVALDDRREARVSMLDAYPALKSMYDPDDGNTEVWYLRKATATFSGFGQTPRTVTF